jgi:polysaccharide pyruvyl transferase WcaK-like protein
LAGNVSLIDADLTPEELALLYGSASFIIATRFHAVVLALCGGAAAIAIPYFGVKTQGSMRDLGLSDLLLEVRDLTLETLKAKCRYCLNQGPDLRAKVNRVAAERYSFAMQSGKKLGEIAHATKYGSQAKAPTSFPAGTN